MSFSPMPLHGAASSELVIAQLATERSASRVAFHVSFQVLCAREKLRAERTWLLWLALFVSGLRRMSAQLVSGQTVLVHPFVTDRTRARRRVSAARAAADCRRCSAPVLVFSKSVRPVNRLRLETDAAFRTDHLNGL